MWTCSWGNCLHHTVTDLSRTPLLEKLPLLFSKGRFKIRQWASNTREVIQHLPPEARSTSTELWFSQMGLDLQEPALGHCWACIPYTLGYTQVCNHYSSTHLKDHIWNLGKPIWFIGLHFTLHHRSGWEDLDSRDQSWREKLYPARGKAHSPSGVEFATNFGSNDWLVSVRNAIGL